VAFGGPAAHVAMMRAEVVTRRGWLTDREFLDLVSATNLIPGPNSTELAIHIGHRRAGWPGLLIAGTAFILPAAVLVFALAWAYVQYGEMPDVRRVFYGIAPVVIAIVAQALWGMAKTAVTSGWLAVMAVAAMGAAAAGVHELLVLGGAVVVALIGSSGRGLRRAPGTVAGLLAVVFMSPRAVAATVMATATAAGSASLSTLFWIFLKTGAVLFGSGYVLLAFLRADFVDRLGWLTEAQLLDAIAIGRFTPGPVFTTATFIGYRLGGTSGASLALMAVVTWQLGRASLVDVTTVAIAAASLGVLLTTWVNSAWLILAGAIIALLLRRG
jgi:chromate transporter